MKNRTFFDQKNFLVYPFQELSWKIIFANLFEQMKARGSSKLCHGWAIYSFPGDIGGIVVLIVRILDE
jgi:hypothetical protein